MTIREIETRTGLDRANIRFYEREGLLAPARLDNGYRDYTDDDLALLLKIKLLRRLGFSLDAIRALKDGESGLDFAITQRLAGIADERRSLAAAERVCREMRDDRAVFSTLDAERYLGSLSRAASDGAALPPSVPATDRVEQPRIPWRRFFARGVDLGLIELARLAVLALVFRVNLTEIPDLLDLLLDLLDWMILIPLEALCLSRFGTTPGKWLWGIRVEHADGRRLTFAEAATRALGVLRYGEGFTIPIYAIIRNYKSYKAVMGGRPTEWDGDCTVILRDERRWRIAAYLASQVILVLATFAIGLSPMLDAMLPPNRGELTVDEFVENYNYLNDYFDLYNKTLLSDGTFTLDDGYSVLGDSYYTDLSLLAGDPIVLDFAVEDGAVVGVSYSRTITNYGSTSEDEAVVGAFYSRTITSNGFTSEDATVIQLAYTALAWADASPVEMYGSLRLPERFEGLALGTRVYEYYGFRLSLSVSETTDLTDGSAHLVEFSLTRIPE